MKKAAVLAFVLVFAACMIHYYYAEDHCPVHCPSPGGRLGHVHSHHHPAASTCLCFWSSLFSPEAGEFTANCVLLTLVAGPAAGRPLRALASDITHPPRSLLV